MRRVSTREVRERLSDILGSVYFTREPVVVERNGRPFAVLVNPDLYEEWRHDREAKLWETVDRAHERNLDVNPDDVEADVAAVVKQVRRERAKRGPSSDQRGR